VRRRVYKLRLEHAPGVLQRLIVPAEKGCEIRVLWIAQDGMAVVVSRTDAAVALREMRTIGRLPGATVTRTVVG
jgi:limonene-1,2-epoxide hydrolase